MGGGLPPNRLLSRHGSERLVSNQIGRDWREILQYEPGMVMARSISELTRITWPGGKRFAFTIFDDTDNGTVENLAPVYALLTELGFRITKTAWPLAASEAPTERGQTCAEPEYLAFVQKLKAEGHEIGYHHATSISSIRQRTLEGIARFKELFGPLAVAANHYDNLESLYWGAARLSGPARWAYHLLTRFKSLPYQGHLPDSPYFWGDICQREVEFFRNFVFADINPLKNCSYMPYHDSQRPYAQSWYASSDGGHGDSFCRLLSPENQEQLEREGGCCIVYTHFARKFLRPDGTLRPDFVERMTMLSRRNGWFAPTGEVLRYLRDQHGGVHELTAHERRRLEWSWLWDKIFLGST